MDVKFFDSQNDFRAWLEANHDKMTELRVGIYKKASGRTGMTYKEGVEEALCFGWIDGIGNSIDEGSYTVRFTPRKPKSIWSAVNIKRVAELTEAGKMHASGLKAFETRDRAKENQYSSEQKEETLKFSVAQEKALRANKDAWEFFHHTPTSYRKAAIWWVISAKQEETREKRLAELIDNSARGLKIKHLRRKTDQQE